jgi:hypothetical protein
MQLNESGARGDVGRSSDDNATESHHGHSRIPRDHLILRTEAASNNVNDYGVNKSVENPPVLRKAMSAINDNYLNVQQDILETFVDRGQLRKLAEPTITSAGKRIPGLKLDHPWQLALMHALVRFAHVAAGNTFTGPKSTPPSSKRSASPPSTTRSLPSATTYRNSAPRVLLPSSPTLAVINCSRRDTRLASSS